MIPSFVKQSSYLLDAPHISQLPEWMRGCEVTSLAMLLNYHGVEVDKLELSHSIKYVPFEVNNVSGNMNKGFVGNIETFSQPGLGVYQDLIMELASYYKFKRKRT